jgi:hypothetical protein
MMKFLRILLLLILPFFLNLNSPAQIGYSPTVDSLVQEIRFDSLMLLTRQITGDTSVMVNGTLDTIFSRYHLDPGNALAAQFIKEKFQSFGLDVHLMEYDEDGQNVIGTKTGTLFPDQQFIICAHYDSRPFSNYAPGADDNASGVCGIIEAARLASGVDFPFTLKFIAFDEEEAGLIGSAAYVDSAVVNGNDIRAVLNLDMIAWDSDADNKLSISANDASMSLMSDLMTCIRIYRPELSPSYASLGGSDHYKFWLQSYKAIHAREDRFDINPYYHTVDDDFSNIHYDFYYRMVQLSIATFFSWGLGNSMEISHIPLANTMSPFERQAKLVMDPKCPADMINSPPRLYYRVNDGEFQFITPSSVTQDSVFFTLPASPYGSKVSYYFAAQDTSGSFSVTLPDAGQGVNPPGTEAPGNLYEYYIMRDTSIMLASTDVPVDIIAVDTIRAEINVPASGRILDINVHLSLTHTRTWELSIFLVTPDGQQLELSSQNGYLHDNYISTVFDDEANSYIQENKPPFTGCYRPENPLSTLDDCPSNGVWSLAIYNQGYYGGQLQDFSLELLIANQDYYVDASLPFSGDGLSPATAFNTISDACQLNPSPGTNIFIKPGIYNEEPTIISNGEEVLPLTTGIQLLDTNVIALPQGTDLSSIDLVNHPGGYYAYVFRSRLRNSGCFKITGVDDAMDRIHVNGANFLPEEGQQGELDHLSCAIGRPVIYRKLSGDPGNERVIIDVDGDTSINSILYIGEPIGDGTLDAMPANFNIIDGLDVTGAELGTGIKVQSSSFNIIKNAVVNNNGTMGIHIAGNETRPSSHNFILNNIIYNSPVAGISIGQAEQPAIYNHSSYNHLINNKLFVQSGGSNASMSKAVTVWEDNTGTVVSHNELSGLALGPDESACVEIHSGAHFSLVFGNSFLNIKGNGTERYSLFHLHEGNQFVEFFNNTASDTLTSDGMYAFRLDGSGSDSCRVVHNTIFQIENGFLLEDYTTISDFHIQNNIIHATGEYFTNLGNAGRFQFSYNLYFSDPAPDPGMAYYNEVGRQIGEVEFADPDEGNFNLGINSGPAICNGASLVPVVYIDPDRELRHPNSPDIGAYELENKVVWEGAIGSEWHNPANWKPQNVPGSDNNVIIGNGDYMPEISNGTNYVNGIFLMDGADLFLRAPATLIVSPQ